MPDYTYDLATYDAGVYAPVGSVLVELLINSVWTEITAYVRVSQGIHIRRGRQDWSSTPTYATCDMTLDNRDGRFSPRNPSGAYYGYIGRNTQIRVSVTQDDGTTTIRFWGDVSSWPVGWDKTAREAWVDIEATGLRRRLTIGSVPLLSPLRRAVPYLSPVAYWPMEDGSVTTSFGSALTTGYPMLVTGQTVTGAASDNFYRGSSQVAVLAGVGASVSGAVRSYTIAADGSAILGQSVRMAIQVSSGTAAQGVDVVVGFGDGASLVAEYAVVANTIQATFFPANGAASTTTGALTCGSSPLSSRSQLCVFTQQIGADTNFGVDFGPDTLDQFTEFSALAVGITQTKIVSVRVINAGTVGGTDITTVLGHVYVVTPDSDPLSLAVLSGGKYVSAFRGYENENANARASRLCNEEGVSASVGSPNTGNVAALMGPQPQDTFVNLIDECAFVDGGFSTESVTARAVQFRCLSALFDQATGLGLSYSSGRFTGLVPVDDDQYTVNDSQVSRPNGGSARYQITTGNLSVSAIGDYAQQVSVNSYSDDLLPYQAQWRATVGTVDAPRWPVIAMDGANTVGASNRAALIALREGDQITLNGLPALSGTSGAFKVVVLGWSETITHTTWDFSFNCLPADLLQQMLKLDDATYGKLDTDRLGL